MRLHLFQSLLARAQPWARRRRTRQLSVFNLKGGERVVDLGGTCEIWQLIDTPLDITLVNLPGVDVKRADPSIHTFHYIAGDATDLKQFPDEHFDLAFSNSVIEHVGGEANQQAFSREVRRLARAYYVQTPSIWFPLEPHTGIPFWWALPQSLRRRIIARWRTKVPAWTDMVEGTTVIGRRTLQDYFPDGTLLTERVAGIPKSYSIYRTV